MRTIAGSLADLDVLASSWRLSLEAECKSPATITSYTYATTQLSAFLRESGMPTDVDKIAREHIEAFLVHVIENRQRPRPRPATAACAGSSAGASPRGR